MARLGAYAWHVLTDVRFAVLLITLLAVAGLVGMLVRQFPITAGDDPVRYAIELADQHRAWDGIQPLGLPLGSWLVDGFSALGLFSVFSTAWFLVLMTVLVISITVCTADRTPRLWRGVHQVLVGQPAAFFDPRLDHRASLRVGSPKSETRVAVAAALRSRGFRRQRTAHVDGADIIYGDRNQYMKMATLLTHTGLVLFLLGGAVTVAMGFETVVFVAEGESAPVQRVGTEGNLLVRNHAFEAPQRADGSFADFSTDLSVFRDGAEIARQTIRVNDPLVVEGFVFHQNTFGPTAELTIHDRAGRLVWDGPLLLDGEVLGRPQGFMTIPGAEVGLMSVLSSGADGTPQLVLQGVGRPEDESGEGRSVFLATIPMGVTTDPEVTAGHSIRWDGVGAWSGMVIKHDPGQPVIWLAFVLLILGLALTFYFPRRRAWARMVAGQVALAFTADRYVDQDTEFRQLTEAVAAATGGVPPFPDEGMDPKRAGTAS